MVMNFLPLALSPCFSSLRIVRVPNCGSTIHVRAVLSKCSGNVGKASRADVSNEGPASFAYVNGVMVFFVYVFVSLSF